MLVTIGVAVGFCIVVADRFGPLQLYTPAPPDGLALRVAELPKQTGPLLFGAATGLGLTFTVVV